MNESYARRMLCETCARLYDRNLTVSAGGNMSVRCGEYILITPSGRNKGMLRPKDMVKVSIDGNVVSGRPSIETEMHLALYRENPGTNAVIHCHPLHCTVLAVRGERIRCDLTPEGVLLLGDVPMVRYVTPGTKELADAVASHSDSKAMLMERHGSITQGKDLQEAYDRMEELEFQARLQMLSGNAEGLPKEEIAKILGACR